MQKLTLLLFALTSSIVAQPSITGANNAVSGQLTFSPGSLAAVYGTNLVVSGSATTVTVGGKAAYVYPQSIATQLLVEVPVDAATGPTTMTVTAGGQTSAPLSLTIAAYAPAVNSANGSGTGIGLFFDGTTNKQITATNPAIPGQTLIGYSTGLGATTPALATGVAATGPGNPTAAAVTVTIGAEQEPVAFAGQVPSASLGAYQLNFTIPKDATGCGTSVVVTVGGISSPPVSVPIATPTPTLCSVENSATGLVRDATHGAAAGSFISIYAGAVVSANSAGNIFPATNYQGLEADFNGTPLYLYSVTNLPPSQILINAALAPNTASSGTGVITIKNSAGTSQSYTLELAPADVGVFRLPNPATGVGNQGVALLANSYWFAMPAALTSAYGLPACTGLPATSPCGQPASPGDSIVIYFTGGGLATPSGKANDVSLPLGAVAPADGSMVYHTVLAPTITIGGLPATAAFSGIAPGTASEYQINMTIPTGVQASDTVPVVITMGSSTDTFTIAVKAQ